MTLKSEQNTIDILKSVQTDINALIMQGVCNWQHAMNAFGKINAVIEALERDERTKEREKAIELEKAKIKREMELKEAAERGEKIIGGETIQLNADGTQEVLIP